MPARIIGPDDRNMTKEKPESARIPAFHEKGRNPLGVKA
jgi:hypothetical protein